MTVYSPLHRCLGLSLFCLWVASPAADGPLPDLAPAVRSVFPLGARAGETIEVTFFGRRLNDLADITFARKDIHCDVISSGDFIVKAKVSVGPDVPTGLHDYRVRTRRGTYVGVFHVSSCAALREVEPNNDLAHAQPVELPAMVDASSRAPITTSSASTRKAARIWFSTCSRAGPVRGLMER
jgi:hypothetical protein